MRQQHIPRLVVGAPRGRSGKTTITIGLLAALTAAGYRVQPFKRGPDFIDPSWMTKITGRPCRNLDGYLMDQATIRASLGRSVRKADIAVVEGAMGLYDGVGPEGVGCTADVAKTIDAPVLLVVDCTRITRSIAALVSGYQHFDPRVQIAGVILNKVARPRHQQVLTQNIRQHCQLPVLGVIPKGTQFNIPDRHLGLIPAQEDQALAQQVLAAGEVVGQYLDLPAIVAVARQAAPLTPETSAEPENMPAVSSVDLAALKPAQPVCRLAVFMDRAFSFYYPENLESLVAAGAELVFVDALGLSELPPVDGVYIGGGFPELFAAQLSANVSLRRQLKDRIEDYLPVYAECGGLMYLSRSLHWQGRSYDMCDVLPLEVEMTAKPQGHGYTTLEVIRANPFWAPGQDIKGHEFHHSRARLLAGDGADFAFQVVRGHGIENARDGLCYKNVLATYTHIHALATPNWAQNFVAAARKYREKA